VGQEEAGTLSCGGCGAKRAAANKAAGGAGKVTKYRITWGDGSNDLFDTYSAARLAMGDQKDVTKRRGMRVTSVAV
jgi:hypothetical protein